MMDDINSNSDSSIELDSDACKSEFESISRIFTLDIKFQKIKNFKFRSKKIN